MKKWMFLFVLLFVPIAIFAQEIPDPPENWYEVLMNPGIWFASAGAFAVLVTFITAFFNGLLKVEKKFIRQLIAWVVAIVLLVATNLFDFGYNAEFPIYLSIVEGFTIGLVANGMANIPFVETIRNTVEGWFKKE
jgi:hypothetical protein